MHPTVMRHYVLAALLVITAVNYVQRNCISPAATTIQASIGISPQGLDLANGAFFFAYTLLQVPSGWLAKLWGPRAALAVYAAGWSLALALCAAATGLLSLSAGRILLGIMQAGIFPCATLILASWYPASLRGTATALLNSFMLLGGAAGTMLSGYLLTTMSWQSMFLLYAVPGLLWAAWFYWWFRDRPEEHPSVNQAELDLLASDKPSVPPEVPPFRVSLAAALVLPLVLLYTQQAFRAAAPRLFDQRMPTFCEGRLVKPEGLAAMASLALAPAAPGQPLAGILGGLGPWAEAQREHRGVVARAANLSSWPQWLGVAGGLLGGMLSDYVLRRTGSRVWARNGVAVGSLVVCLTLYIPAAFFIEDIYLAVACFSLGSFFFNMSSPCAYALTIDMGGRHLAVVFGLMNMIGNLGAWVFVSIIMSLVALGGWPLLFTVWLSLHVVAIACWLCLDSERKIE